MASDHINVAITRILLPDLKAIGFVRVKPKRFVRIRGDLVDVITFQFSQWGGKRFYVHNAVVPLCAPYRESYIVGKRYEGDRFDAAKWHGPDAETAGLAIASLRHVALDTMIPWFDSMPDLAGYVEVYLKVHTRRRKSAEYLAMMLALQREAEYEELLLEIDERHETHSPELVELRLAKLEGTAQLLLDRWRNENRTKYKHRETASR